jgi:hypothetical protein
VKAVKPPVGMLLNVSCFAIALTVGVVSDPFISITTLDGSSTTLVGNVKTIEADLGILLEVSREILSMAGSPSSELDCTSVIAIGPEIELVTVTPESA